MKPRFFSKQKPSVSSVSSISSISSVSFPSAGGFSSVPLCSNTLRSLILQNSFSSTAPVILCIGTDRLIGDSLGPITGSFLLQRGCPIPVYGTLEAPVHALNLHQQCSVILTNHPGSPILAIDASLGPEHCIGSLSLHFCGLQPGLAVNKHLERTGDFSITGITSEDSLHPYLSLQSARLSTVIKMAEEICTCILSCLSDKCPA